MKRKGILSGVSFWMCLLAVYAQQLPEEVINYADIVLYNGLVLMADDDFTVAEAIAVRDNKILAVGDTARIRRMAGPRTRRIDLAGRTVVPGFIDTHLHLQTAGGNMNRHNLDSAGATDEDILGRLREIVARTPPGEWVLTRSRHVLTREQLDRVAPLHPVYINIIEEYDEPIIVNSRAWELAQLPDDMPGIDRDPETGEPNGLLWGYAAGVVLFETIPEVPVEPRLEPLREKMREAVAVGLTTVFSQGLPMEISAVMELWRRGVLLFRWRLAHQMLCQNPRAETTLRRVGNLDGLGDDWFRIEGLQPGNPDTSLALGAYVEQPPLNRSPNAPPEGQLSRQWSRFGKNYWSDLEHSGYQHIILANRYGWSIRGMHSAGDRASYLALNAFEEANKERPLAGRRFALDHGPMFRPQDVQRMKEMGIIVSAAPKYITLNMDRMVHMYGPDAIHRMLPVKTLIEAGVKVVAEADVRGEYMAPMWNIEKFVTRQDEQGRVWGPDQRITRQQALLMYTNWAAYYTNDEQRLGTLEPGKLADLVVLNGDFLRVSETEISKLGVDLTLVGGKVVYEAATTSP